MEGWLGKASDSLPRSSPLPPLRTEVACTLIRLGTWDSEHCRRWNPLRLASHSWSSGMDSERWPGLCHPPQWHLPVPLCQQGLGRLLASPEVPFSHLPSQRTPPAPTHIIHLGAAIVLSPFCQPGIARPSEGNNTEQVGSKCRSTNSSVPVQKSQSEFLALSGWIRYTACS